MGGKGYNAQGRVLRRVLAGQIYNSAVAQMNPVKITQCHRCAARILGNKVPVLENLHHTSVPRGDLGALLVEF
jgi:hypothetical protein